MAQTRASDSKLFWRAALFLLALTAGLAAQQIYTAALAENLLVTSRRWQLIVTVAPLLPLLFLALFGLSFTKVWAVVERAARIFYGWLRLLGIFNLIFTLLAMAAFFVILFGTGVYAHFFDQVWVRIFLLLLIGLKGGLFRHAAFPRLSLPENVLLVMLITAAAYQILGHLTNISNYPFSLVWSEGSWYYFSSFFVSKQLYGIPMEWPYGHFTRNLLQALPYVVSGLPMWVHRLWQELLWVGTTGLAAWLLARRLKLTNRTHILMVVLGAYLFLSLGPVYYQLLVPVIIILAGVKTSSLKHTLAVTAAATAWACLSRLNWIPVPGMLAAAIWLLETPYQGCRSWWHYVRQPLWIAVTALLSATATLGIYVNLPGNQSINVLGSSLSSPLLTYRLWPNANLATGLAGGILLVSLPLLAAIFTRLRRVDLHPARWLFLLAMLAVLLAGGFAVSLKIGGGNNLHNFDAYLVLLLVWGAYALSAGLVPETEKPAAHGRAWKMLVWAVMLVSAAGTLLTGISFPQRNLPQANLDLQTVQWKASTVVQAGGKVLFISQRHLLAAGLVQGVPLQPEYEMNLLMEMVMSNNQAYLHRFVDDLREQRYALIVVDHLNPVMRPLAHSFADENNAWVERVTLPLLKYYRVAFTLEKSQVDLLVPK